MHASRRCDGLNTSCRWVVKLNNLIVFLINVFNMQEHYRYSILNNIIFGCNNLFPIAGAIISDSFSVITVFAFVSLLVSCRFFQVCIILPPFKMEQINRISVTSQLSTKSQLGPQAICFLKMEQINRMEKMYFGAKEKTILFFVGSRIHLRIVRKSINPTKFFLSDYQLSY